MTREEAIQVLKEYRTIVMNCLEAETPAFDMAIEALSADTVPIEKYHELQHQFVMLGATFADLTEVVRCKDCIHWKTDSHCEGYRSAEDFCSWGERKE